MSHRGQGRKMYDLKDNFKVIIQFEFVLTIYLEHTNGILKHSTSLQRFVKPLRNIICELHN